MRKKIVFIGGDERQTVAAEEFAKDGFDVRLFGCPSGNGRLESAETLSDAVADSVAAILPVPCSKDGKTVFAPFAEEPIRADEVRNTVKSGVLLIGGGTKKLFPEAVDLLEREDFKILNAIPSAEGAVAVAVAETDITLNGAVCAVIGFGKIGKHLARLLSAFGADTAVTARKPTDFAVAKALGLRVFHTADAEKAVADADIIFNTVPFAVADEKVLKATKKQAVLIELASAPGGIDAAACERLGRKLVKAPGLPGRFSPLSAGKTVYKTVKNILDEPR